MILHYIIKKITSDYGKIIVSDLRLYNILADLNAFKYEPDSIKFVLKQVLQLRGKDIFESSKRSLPAQATLNQYIQYITAQCGFIEKQVRYVVESLAYGIGWISQLSENDFRPESFEQELEITAYLYNMMGINITQIEGSKALNREIHNIAYEYGPDSSYMGIEVLKFDSFKNPTDENWKDYISISQDKDYIANFEWKNKTGLGIICGYNNVRAIDIDCLGCFENCDYEFWRNPREKSENKFDSFIEYCLYLLNLPKDYKWVVRSGSGSGIHIIFKCEDVENLNLEVEAYSSKKVEENLDFNLSGWFFDYKKNVQEDFERLELYWTGHIVASPSRGIGYESFYNNSPYEPNHNQYEFINNSGRIPLEEPSYITVNDIDNLLNNLCGTITSESPWDFNNKHRSNYYHIGKLKTSQNSMGSYNHYKDSIAWLQKCTSIEGVNSLGVAYVLNKEYQKAAECFIKADSDFAHYNYAQLILSEYIPGTKDDLLKHYDKCKNSKRIYEHSLNDLKKDIDNL